MAPGPPPSPREGVPGGGRCFHHDSRSQNEADGCDPPFPGLTAHFRDLSPWSGESVQSLPFSIHPSNPMTRTNAVHRQISPSFTKNTAKINPHAFPGMLFFVQSRARGFLKNIPEDGRGGGYPPPPLGLKQNPPSPARLPLTRTRATTGEGAARPPPLPPGPTGRTGTGRPPGRPTPPPPNTLPCTGLATSSQSNK